MTKVLPRIWCKVYSNGPHFSTTKKDGYTCYVPENLALALFLRAELGKLLPGLPSENSTGFSNQCWRMGCLNAVAEGKVGCAKHDALDVEDEPPKRKRKMIEKESRRAWRKKRSR